MKAMEQKTPKILKRIPRVVLTILLFLSSILFIYGIYAGSFLIGVTGVLGIGLSSFLAAVLVNGLPETAEGHKK